jgi:excisionase family DNA binding protein
VSKDHALVTVREASRLTRYPRDKIYKGIKDGSIPHISLGDHRVLVHLPTFRNWLAEQASRSIREEG